jgi:hypothetical protein
VEEQQDIIDALRAKLERYLEASEDKTRWRVPPKDRWHVCVAYALFGASSCPHVVDDAMSLPHCRSATDSWTKSLRFTPW